MVLLIKNSRLILMNFTSVVLMNISITIALALSHPSKNFQMEKLKSLPSAKQFLKKGFSFKKLDQRFLCRNCNQHAQIVQRERQKLFNKIFALNNSHSGSLFN